MQEALSEIGRLTLRNLTEAASKSGQRIFAVLDGARFNNLPAMLRHANLAHRPLFRHAGGDYAVIVGGPWFVDPYTPAIPSATKAADAETSAADSVPFAADGISDAALRAHAEELSGAMASALAAGDPSGGGVLPDASISDTTAIHTRLERIVTLADGKAAAVFWIGSDTMTADMLFRHLRGINRIAIARPVGKQAVMGIDDNSLQMTAASNEEDVPEAISVTDEMAIFRHGDANVMMQTFPALDAEQAVRLFGPADQLLFAPDEIWGGGVKRARKPLIDMPLSRGPLRIDAETACIIGARRLEVSRTRVSEYLRAVDADTNVLSDSELRRRVIEYETIGRSLGLRSERAHGEWAFLMSTTGGSIARENEVCTAVKNARDPDKKISDILNAMASMAQFEAEGGVIDERNG